MKVIDLLKNVNVVKTIGRTDVDVEDIAVNSNSIQKDCLFICIKGENDDGHNHIKQAERYGAKVVVTEKELNTHLCQIIVKDTRKAMPVIASNYHGNPEKRLKIIGITGTNGKTTTCYLIGKILNGAGVKCGTIGTLGAFYDDKKIETSLTTPDPLALFKILKEMADNNVKAVAMEVSAHAVYFNKVEGIKFYIGVLSNVTHDHLDFFNDMETYKNIKKSFFNKNNVKYMVVNSDDECGLEIIKDNSNVISYGLKNPADVFAIDVKSFKNGTNFFINLFDCVYNIDTKLRGEFNVYNILSACTVCALMGVEIDVIIKQIKNINGADGRFECVYDKDFSVYIDYAHTPDGLEQILYSLKKICKGNLICVFGCGGNRDYQKRSLMGEISGKLSDFTVITSDNPRYEDPMEIIWQIEKGVENKNYIIIQDREQAIEYALKMAKPKDAVIIAGKGSENYQEVLGVKKPYNDKETVDKFFRGKL